MNCRILRLALVALIAGRLSAAEVVLPAGTMVSCRLEQPLSSATADPGQEVQLSVVNAIGVDGKIVIPQGAVVLGAVTLVQKKRRMGRTGKLDFTVDKVRAADCKYIPLRATRQKLEGGSTSLSTGLMTAGAAAVFFPAAPLILLRQGKDVSLTKGMVFEVFTDRDHTLAVGPPEAGQPESASPCAPPASGELATVNITANVTGAEVEVDNVFIGSTPTLAKLAPGLHRITVRHRKSVWSRELLVQAGSGTNVTAVLKK